MNKLLFGLAALPFLAGVALAAEPLSDLQMDRVTAGVTSCSGAACTGGSSTGNGSVPGFMILGNPAITNPGDFTAIVQAFIAYLQANGFTTQP
jgi:hypothetical protein